MADWPFEALTPGSFKCAVVDPPWAFKARTALQMSNPGSRRDVERHYSVMDLAAIKALPVGRLLDRHAHLWLWTTGPMLKVAFEVIEAWGFRYSSTGLIWIKLKRSHNPDQLRTTPLIGGDLHTGLGLTTRKNAEFLLLARRGNARRNAKNVREILLAPVREHSRKPDEAYDRVRAYCDGPYVDLFARESRPGWSSWGNESEKFDGAIEAERQSPRGTPPAGERGAADGGAGGQESVVV